MWDKGDWGIPNGPDDHYCHLMVDWYFERLGTTLTLDDHFIIQSNAQAYIDNVAGFYYASARMEAPLHDFVPSFLRLRSPTKWSAAGSSLCSIILWRLTASFLRHTKLRHMYVHVLVSILVAPRWCTLRPRH